MVITYEIIKSNNYYCIDYFILEKIRELNFKQYTKKKFLDNFKTIFQKKKLLESQRLNGYLLKIKILKKLKTFIAIIQKYLIMK